MIVISDTSPLNYLSQVGQLAVLPGLFDRVIIPEGVRQELRDGIRKHPSLAQVLDAPWIEVCQVTPAPLLEHLRKALDEGESQAIALAAELGIKIILLDEVAGRKAAAEQGITPVGIAGILVRAKARGLIPAVRPILDRLLTDTTMRLGASIYHQALRHAGET